MGKIVVIGSRAEVQINPREIMARQALITGMMIWNTPDSAAVGIYAALGAGLRNGVLQPRVTHEWPLGSAVEAHRRIMKPGALGKIVLLPWFAEQPAQDCDCLQTRCLEK